MAEDRLRVSRFVLVRQAVRARQCHLFAGSHRNGGGGLLIGEGRTEYDNGQRGESSDQLAAHA